jgi:pimeloyl-ACP methyl ester carboxylesterase
MSTALACVARRRELVCPSPSEPSRFVAVYSPEGRAKARVVLCPPLGEEQSRARTALHRVAARLAREGFLAATYDPLGHGDSEGEPETATMATLDRDVVTVAHLVEADVVVGLRFGALVATLAATSGRLPVRKLVLVAPVLRGAPYARELLRASVETSHGASVRSLSDAEAALLAGGIVACDGHRLGAELFRGMLAADAINALASASEIPTELLRLRGRPLAAVLPDAAELSRMCPWVRSRDVEGPPFWQNDDRRVITDLPSLAEELSNVLRG